MALSQNYRRSTQEEQSLSFACQSPEEPGPGLYGHAVFYHCPAIERLGAFLRARTSMYLLVGLSVYMDIPEDPKALWQPVCALRGHQPQKV